MHVREHVVHGCQCALMHADGSSKGKLYVTRAYLCFAGSLFGRETLAVFAVSDTSTLCMARSCSLAVLSLGCATV